MIVPIRFHTASMPGNMDWGRNDLRHHSEPASVAFFWQLIHVGKSNKVECADDWTLLPKLNVFDDVVFGDAQTRFSGDWCYRSSAAVGVTEI